MISKSISAKRVSLREVFYKSLKISYLKDIYRTHIIASFVSLARKYSFSKDLVKRFQDYRSTKKNYRGLKNLIKFKIETKKISQAWKYKDYFSFFKLTFFFILASPIWLLNKTKSIKIWLQSLEKQILKIAGKKK